VVCDRAQVGPRARVVDSIIGPDATVEADVMLDGCILGAGARVDAGTTLVRGRVEYSHAAGR
jgi:NDP-sugar pyrophosphorylase family protein